MQCRSSSLAHWRFESASQKMSWLNRVSMFNKIIETQANCWYANKPKFADIRET